MRSRAVRCGIADSDGVCRSNTLTHICIYFLRYPALVSAGNYHKVDARREPDCDDTIVISTSESPSVGHSRRLRVPMIPIVNTFPRNAAHNTTQHESASYIPGASPRATDEASRSLSAPRKDTAAAYKRGPRSSPLSNTYTTVVSRVL